MSVHSRRPLKDRRGQGLAEFALVAPIMILLVLSVAQFGIIFESQIGLTNAAREDARRASTNPSPTCTWVLDEIKPTSGTGLLASNIQGYSDGDSTVKVTFSGVDTASTPAFQTVDVDVIYRHPLFLPLIREILDAIDGTPDGGLTLSTDVQMRMDTTSTSVVGSCQRP